ncbi:unnamed protein product [Thlaspi arvense]|uniref:CobW C-terminal domain-containing protein n=1 Tax=Thlaspi arvense TaxID=13288 RepID=A0AAU9R8C5_THLAR|nr:unnamed protein product [Thlaspi arvense]
MHDDPKVIASELYNKYKYTWSVYGLRKFCISLQGCVEHSKLRPAAHFAGNAVKEIYEIVPARKWSEEESRTNKIVFIGHKLDEEALKSGLRDCRP